MNLIKIYLISFIVLFMCTWHESDGLFLGLLMRIMLLKGAMFIGAPIAMGSFLMGQGVGFLGGNMVGGYAMLRAAQRYHEYERGKWTGGTKGSGYSVVTKGFKAAKLPSYDTSYTVGEPESGYGEPAPYDDHYDSGYVPVSPGSYGYGAGYSKGYSKGPTKYEGGYAKGILLGAGLKGFKDGFRSPYGGHTVYSHSKPSSSYVSSYGPSYGPSHGSSYVSSYGSSHGYQDTGYYESQQAPHYQPHPEQSIRRQPPTLFQKIMNIPSMFRKPSAPPKHPAGAPNAYHQNPYKHGAFQHPFAGTPQVEAGHIVYNSPGQQYGGVVSQVPTSQFHSSDLSVPDGTISQVSVHEEQPSYASSGSISLGETGIIKSYDGSDQPKSEPMGVGYFSNEYEPGIPTDDLSISFAGSDFPEKPNGYGEGKPLGQAIGAQEYSSYYTQGHLSPLDPLDIQASVAYEVTNKSPFKYDATIKKIGQQQRTSASTKANTVVTAPNNILEKFLEQKLEEKAQKAKGEMEKKEAKNLIKLLRKAYIKQLIDSLNAGKSPSEKQSEDVEDFKPFPKVPNSTTEPATALRTAASSETGQQYTTAPSLSNSRFSEIVAAQLRLRRQSQQDNSIPSSESPSTEQPPTLPPMTKEDQEKFVKNFVEDVKNFFVLVSALDQDTCLQKLVCDVHTRADQPDLTTYETNIISTFRVMDTLMPANEEDSSMIYRRAARVGEIGSSPEVCQKSYASCGYTASQIISFGKQVEDAEPSNLNPVTYGASVTAMPRV